MRKHGAAAAGGGDGSKRQKAGDKPLTSSAFQELFTQRAQGFQIDFRFRNAPPRPPVGPCFVGNSLDAVLLEQSRVYKPQNAVEMNHTWKLHSEPDIGVPLAPSAMNLKSYEKPDDALEDEDRMARLHPDDRALLDWKGSLGDTAADNLKRRQETARAAARLTASGRSPPPKIAPATNQVATTTKPKKKAFSRVLDEEHQTWMKKTTYLSNDYSRKVHDFKSLAQTKSEVAVDLETKQTEMSQRRSVKAITESFQQTKPLQHPTNKQLKPKKVIHVLPDVSNWGRAFTHVVVDKAPTNLPGDHTVKDLDSAFVSNVEKRQANARMTCNMLVPSTKEDGQYDPIQAYDLDVVPLKDEDMPHMNFCFWVDHEKGVANYVPVASRVQLATGRPARNVASRSVERRPVTDKEQEEMEERMAEIDQDMAEKHHVTRERRRVVFEEPTTATGAADKKDGDDDGEDDFGDDDSSSDEEVFGGGTKTIVAES